MNKRKKMKCNCFEWEKKIKDDHDSIWNCNLWISTALPINIEVQRASFAPRGQLVEGWLQCIKRLGIHLCAEANWHQHSCTPSHTNSSQPANKRTSNNNDSNTNDSSNAIPHARVYPTDLTLSHFNSNAVQQHRLCCTARQWCNKHRMRHIAQHAESPLPEQCRKILEANRCFWTCLQIEREEFCSLDLLKFDETQFFQCYNH